MMAVSIPVAVVLALAALLGGIGITAIGPGGVLPTIGLFVLTGMPPAQVAGTAIVTHVAAGGLGTVTYLQSAQLRDRQTVRSALVLAGAALVGTPVGVVINSRMSVRWFGLLLAILVVAVAALVLYRQSRRAPVPHRHPRALTVAAIGVFVAIASGIIGVGGPMLTVPLLVACGAGILKSLAAAQVQSVVVAGVGTVGYLAGGAIDWPLAIVIGVPELAGVLIGWRIARVLPTRTLTYTLVIALFVIAPYLALQT
jgi:uncharacterized membrane protein YfcA